MSRYLPALRRHRRDRGAAAVELALTLPVLLLLVGGIVDFGRAFNAQMTMTQAAREGARMVALGYTTAQAQARATQAASGLPVTVTVVTGCPANPDGTQASVVRVTHTFNYILVDGIVNLIGASMPATQTLTSQGSMRCAG